MLLVFGAPGCKRGIKDTSHTTDPSLQAIDQLLNKQLPKGTPRARVDFFLNSRGYNQEAVKRDSIVAVVHHVDTQTLQPSTARVTFHFDAHDRLVSYDLQPAPEPAPQP